MISPLFLSTDNKIVVIAPSGKVVKSKTDFGIQALIDQGWDTYTGSHLYEGYFRFAGDDSSRIEDLQAALNDTACKAIFCARGGYGITRIIDQLDFSAFVAHPKWIIGFSDITALHCHINKLGIKSIHGPMPNSFKATDPEHVSHLFELLNGELDKSYFFTSEKINRPGVAKGKLIGGNLSILAHLAGTSSFPDFNNNILFLEDLNEELYHTDRMLVQLQRAGIFDQIAGIMIGSFTSMKDSSSDPFGLSVFEMIDEKIKKPNIPICSGFPVGHEHKNLPVIVGQEIKLEASLTEARFKYVI